MKEWTNSEEEITDLWMALQSLEEGTLLSQEREELMTLLESSPFARQAYLEYFHQSAVFKMEGAKLHEQGLLPVADLSQRSRRLFQRSILYAAAVILVLGAVAALVAVRQPEPGLLSATVAAETQWSVDGVVKDGNAANFTVVEGSAVQVNSGTVRLGLDSGARIVLQGPAHVVFTELRRPVLKSGWLWIDSGEVEGETFAVEARRFVVRDIGTRFGVRVAEEGAVEVHLVEGEVEVARGGASAPVLSLLPTGKGTVLEADGKVEEVTLAPDPFPGLTDLLAAEANYRTAVRSQAAVGYWDLDEVVGRECANAIAEQSPATVGREVEVGTPGPQIARLREENRCVRLLGHEEKSVLVGLGSTQGVSRREGAAAFWLRRDPGLVGSEALWLAGETDSDLPAPEEALLTTALTTSGHLRFSIENGKFDVVLSSTRTVTDGKWHHVVVSWGPSAVELYVDGKLAARDADSRILKEGNFTGRYVRFGKPATDLKRAGMGSFNGWVDEIALWNRPLTHAEVRQQFLSSQVE